MTPPKRSIVLALPLASMLVVAGSIRPCMAAAASGDGLDLRLDAPTAIDGTSPFDLSLTVTNHGSIVCQVSSAPTAASIVGVTRDGHAVSPQLEGPAVFLTPLPVPDTQLVTVPVGGSIVVPVGHDLRSVETLSAADGQGVIERWTLGTAGRYEITASLAPGAVSGCAAPAPASALIQASDLAGVPQLPLLAVVVGAVALIAVGLGVIAWRRRRAGHALAAILALVAGMVGSPRGAAAQIVDRYDGGVVLSAPCYQLFQSPGGDPAGIYRALQSSPQQIEVTEAEPYLGISAHPADAPGVDVRVYWSPTVVGIGDVASDGCANLYHLLQYALDASLGTSNYRICPGGLNLETVRGYTAENAYRRWAHLPEHQTVDGKPLPPSLADCQPTKPKRKGKLQLTCGNRPCGSLRGDPHLVTFDGVRYDLQSVGEFVLTRSDDGAVEIQARQQALAGWRSVSAATAIAARIGTSRVTISLASTGSAESPDTLTVDVDGAAMSAAGPQSVGGAGSVERSEAGDQVALRWQAGSIALATIIPGGGIGVEVRPADSLRGQLSGLLGDDDGSSANDLQLAEGSVITSPPSFADLHGPFADAWRVTDATSLFDYAPGTTTATFTDRTFPPSADDVAVADQLDGAQSICEALGADPADAADLSDCAYDLAATGQAGFAMAAVDASLPGPDDVVELGNDSASAGSTPAPSMAVVDRGPMAAGDTVTGTFGSPTERELYDLHVGAGTIGDFTAGGDCSSLSGSGTPTWHLATADAPDQPITGTLPFCNDLGRYAFPAAGDYLLVADAGGFTVPYSFTWTPVAGGSTQSIAVGSDVSGSLSTPGQRDVYVLTTTADVDISLVSPNACDDGFVAKVTQGDSSPGIVPLCGTSQSIHLGGGGMWQITISNPDTTGAYSFRVQVN